MSYEIHAYCANAPAPTIRQMLTWLRDEVNGWGVLADAPGETARRLDSSRWREFELVYGRKNQEPRSLLLGCYRNNGPRSDCAKMARAQLDMVADYRDSPGKQRVLGVLAKTQFIIWCRIDNDGDRAHASPVLDLLASLLGPYDTVLDLEDEGYLADSDTPLCGWCAHDE